MQYFEACLLNNKSLTLKQTNKQNTTDNKTLPWKPSETLGLFQRNPLFSLPGPTLGTLQEIPVSFITTWCEETGLIVNWASGPKSGWVTKSITNSCRRTGRNKQTVVQVLHKTQPRTGGILGDFNILLKIYSLIICPV